MRYRVNLDFDQALHLNNVNFRKDKINHTFEYVYLLLNQNNKDTLVSSKKYQKEYLDYLSHNGFIVPEIQPSGTSENWWGSFDEYKLSRQLNSKVWSAQWAKNLGYAPQGLMAVSNELELDHYMSATTHDKFYYRSEYGFSGLSNKVLEKGKIYKLRYPGTILNYLDVEMSFGITIDLENNNYFIARNEINSVGNFLGGRITCVEEIVKLTGVDIKEQLKIIIDQLKQFVKCGTIQFDSLIYKENNEKKWYPVVEINYRKSMGLVIKRLFDMFGAGVWVICRNTFKGMSREQIILELQKNNEIILTSPLDENLISYYILD